MRTLRNFANKKVFGRTGPYKTFENYLDAIYSPQHLPPSLILLSHYDQLLFGLALAAPLPFVEDRNLAVGLPMIRKRQAELKKFEFRVQVTTVRLFTAS